MPKNKSTRVRLTVRNTDGDAITITNTKVKQGDGYFGTGGSYVRLADVKRILRDTKNGTLASHGEIMLYSNYSNEAEFKTFLRFPNSKLGRTHGSIGCEYFTPHNFTKILQAARKTTIAPKAKAMAAHA